MRVKTTLKLTKQMILVVGKINLLSMPKNTWKAEPIKCLMK